MTSVPNNPAPLDIRRSRGFSQQLTFTFDFLRQNFRPLSRSVLYIAGPAIALATVVSSSSYLSPGNSIASASIVGWVLFIVILALLTAIANSYVFLYLQRDGAGISVGDIWNYTRGMFWRIFWLILGLGIVIGTVMITGAGFAGVAGREFVILLFMVIAFPLGIYCVVLLTPFFTAAIHEDIVFTEALSRCRELMKGNWWSTFGIMASIYAIIIVAMMIFQIPTYLAIFAPMAIADIDPFMITLFLLLDMLRSILFYLLSFLPVLAATLQYFNLVEKVDGVGVIERIQNFGDAPSSGQDVRADTAV